MFDGYLNFGGTELINAQRTTEYIRNLMPSFGLFRITHDYDNLRVALGDEEYRSPFLDQAEWVETDGVDDPSPRNPSHGFYGLYPLSLEGFGDSTMGATVTEGILDGGFINRERDATRPLRIRGLLIGADRLAVEAGLTWLRNALRQNGCGLHGDQCGYNDLRFLLAPPDVCDPKWSSEYTDEELGIELGILDVDSSPLLYSHGEEGQPHSALWHFPMTDGVIIEWGAHGYDTHEVLETHGPVYVRRSNFILNPSFTTTATSWSAVDGTIARVDLGADSYGHADQIAPVVHTSNWLPDPSFEHGDPESRGWRGSGDITAAVDGTAPQGTHVAVVAASADPIHLEATMLGPFDTGLTGTLSFWTANPEDVTVTVADNTGAVIFTEAITGIGAGWQRVSVDDVPILRNHVVRITTDGSSELRVDGMMLTEGALITYFDGDSTDVGTTVYSFVGGFAGPSRKDVGTLDDIVVESAQTDAPFGNVVLTFSMRATESTPSVFLEILDPDDVVISSTTLAPGTAWTRYALGAGFGRQVRARFTSTTGDFDLDLLMLEAGISVNAYFDGNYPAPTDYTLGWVGTADNSISRMTWTGTTLIERTDNFRPFLSVSQNHLDNVTLDLHWAEEIDMAFQLEPYDRTYHRVATTQGVVRIRDYVLDVGAATEVDFVFTAGTPHAFSTQSEAIDFDPDPAAFFADEVTNLAPRPSAEVSLSNVVVRTNVCSNPSGESATTGWTVTAGTSGVAAVTNPAPSTTTAFGTKVLKATWSVAQTGGFATFTFTQTTGIVAGTVYSFHLNHLKTSINNSIQLGVNWLTAGGGFISQTAGTIHATVAGTIYSDFTLLNAVAPALATQAQVFLINQGSGFANWTVGSYIEADGFMITAGGTAPTYFDGATVAAGDYTYAWIGTAHLSASTRTAPVATGFGSTPAGTGALAVDWRTTSQFHDRTHAARTFVTVSPSTDAVWTFGVDATPANWAAVLGDMPYIASIWVRPSKTQRMFVRATPYTAADGALTDVDGTAVVVVGGVWTRLSVAFTTPTTARKLRVRAASTSSGTSYSRWAADDYLDLDGVMVNYGATLVDYFDGATVDSAAYNYTWLGTVDASASLRTLATVTQDPLIDPDVPVIAEAPRPPVIPDVAITAQNEWVRYSIVIPRGNVALWAGTVPTLVLRTLADDVRQVRVRFHPNPYGWAPEDVDVTNYCGEFLLSYLPPNSTLTVSGTTQEAWASVAGGAPQPANQLLYGTGGTPMDWPELSCGLEYLLTVDVPPTVDFDNLEIDLVVNRRE